MKYASGWHDTLLAPSHKNCCLDWGNTRHLVKTAAKQPAGCCFQKLLAFRSCLFEPTAQNPKMPNLLLLRFSSCSLLLVKKLTCKPPKQCQAENGEVMHNSLCQKYTDKDRENLFSQTTGGLRCLTCSRALRALFLTCLAAFRLPEDRS